MNRKIILGVIGLLILGAIFYIESGKNDVRGSGENSDIEITENNLTTEQKAQKYERAKEITTPDDFINTEGVTVSELIGKKVILIDFWTYSCINCQRTQPHLNNWYEKYKDQGLEILGIHTPEFEFEKELENVEEAVRKFGIKYPVILDNDFSTWSSYRNRYWPRKYLIDIDGFIIYDHIGEGAYEETEAIIVEALKERKERLGEFGEIDTGEMASGEGVDHREIETPEIYFGSSRLKYLINLPGEFFVGESIEFNSPEKILKNTFALDGKWKIQEEYAELVGERGSIFLNFKASKVNFVASSDTKVEAEIYLDGKIVDTYAGEDVEDGEVKIREATLYNLIDLDGKYEEHILEIRIKDSGLEVFTFTFG